MTFEEAIQKIEESGGFNPFSDLQPVFAEHLKTLKPENHLERGLVHYYSLLGYLKGQLVHETKECIEAYSRMDACFQKAAQDLKARKDLSWDEEADFYHLMKRCYGSLAYLYRNHDFKSRESASVRRRMQFKKAEAKFRRHYLTYFKLWIFEFTSDYGTSFSRWANVTLMFLILTAFLHMGLDEMVPPEVRMIPENAHFIDYFYFSTITLTTVGFGDITPIHPIAKLLTSIQAFTGFIMLGLFMSFLQKRL